MRPLIVIARARSSAAPSEEPDSKHALLKKNHTAGLCTGCRLLYRWRRGSERSLRQARCGRCGKALIRTMPTRLPRSRARSATGPPSFVSREQCDREEGKVKAECDDIIGTIFRES